MFQRNRPARPLLRAPRRLDLSEQIADFVRFDRFVDVDAPLADVHQRVAFPRVEAREVPVPALDVLGRPRPAQHQHPVRVRLQARPRAVALVHVVHVPNAEKLGSPLDEVFRDCRRWVPVVRDDVHPPSTHQRGPIPSPGAHLDDRPFQRFNRPQRRFARHRERERVREHRAHEVVPRHATRVRDAPAEVRDELRGGLLLDFIRRSVSAGDVPKPGAVRLRRGGIRRVDVQTLVHAPREELAAYLGVQRGVHVAVRLERADAQRFFNRSIGFFGGFIVLFGELVEVAHAKPRVALGVHALLLRPRRVQELRSVRLCDALDRRVVRLANLTNRRLPLANPQVLLELEHRRCAALLRG
mmetsp:Transcript_9736/g.44362  ORF Transcript_9736/g.44362 Transcript_9736/m.44362 type:complete len:356 (-) Transcript_9736:1346-2413(-)